MAARAQIAAALEQLTEDDPTLTIEPARRGLQIQQADGCAVLCQLNPGHPWELILLDEDGHYLEDSPATVPPVGSATNVAEQLLARARGLLDAVSA